MTWCLPFPKIVLFDIETTDAALAHANGTVPEIIEIAAVRLDRFLEVEESFEMLVCPIIIDSVTIFVSEGLTGITQDMIKDKPLWSEAWEKFAEFTEFTKIPLMSFGIASDISVLRYAYTRAKLGYPHSHRTFDIPSLILARAARSGLEIKQWSLNKVCNLFGVERTSQHRAMVDVMDTLTVLKVLAQLED